MVKIMPDAWKPDGEIELKEAVTEGSSVQGCEGFTYVSSGKHSDKFCIMYRDKRKRMYAVLSK